MERWQVPESAAGERIDRHLALERDLPRNQVQRWIREGWVRLDGRRTKPSQVLAGGEWLECESPPPTTDGELTPEAGELEILHQDPHIVVVDKPAGLTVHPGAGQQSGTLAHFLLARYPEMAQVGSRERPGIVHRLDQGTSGVLVVARSARSYRKLSEAFSRHQVSKKYLAIVYGQPRPGQGRIDAPLGRDPRERKRMTVRHDGRTALTLYRSLASAQGISLLEVDLATGRTHQIRVHFKSVGYPLVGDPVYGEARWRGRPSLVQAALRRFPRPALHAWRLRFRHPDSGVAVAFEAPVPEDLAQLWEDTTGRPMPDLPGGNPPWD